MFLWGDASLGRHFSGLTFLKVAFIGGNISLAQCFSGSMFLQVDVSLLPLVYPKGNLFARNLKGVNFNWSWANFLIILLRNLCFYCTSLGC
jgi:hypothetical protein